MATTSASCTFEGPVIQVRVVGAGRAIMLDPAVFEDGNTSWVQFVGALENSKLTSGLANLDPIQLNPLCARFDATYSSGAEITVAVAQGGAEGGFVGKLPSGRDCTKVCRVVWAGEKKLLLVRNDKDEPAQLAGPIPQGDPVTCPNAEGGTASRAGLEVLVLSAATGGVLTCGDRKTPIEQGDWVFRSGPTQSLLLKHLHVRGSVLEARVQSETAPLPKHVRFPTATLSKVPVPDPFPWTLVASVLGAVLALLLIGLVLWARRNAVMGKLSPALRKELNDALLDAFRTREKLEQMVRHGLDKNLNEFAGTRDLRDTVFQLLEDAEAHGYTRSLVQAARNENKGNKMLAEVARQFSIP